MFVIYILISKKKVLSSSTEFCGHSDIKCAGTLIIKVSSLILSMCLPNFNITNTIFSACSVKLNLNIHLHQPELDHNFLKIKINSKIFRQNVIFSCRIKTKTYFPKVIIITNVKYLRADLVSVKFQKPYEPI